MYQQWAWAVTISSGMKPFGETKNKAMRGYAQSGKYHTIVEDRDSTTRTHRPFTSYGSMPCILD